MTDHGMGPRHTQFLNTFIDDVFAFIIRMPTIHRVSVLRDDIVFFIYLYQRWIYRVDPTRTGDMGGVDDTGDAAAPADGDGSADGAPPAEGETETIDTKKDQ